MAYRLLVRGIVITCDTADEVEEILRRLRRQIRRARIDHREPTPETREKA
jgi:hypothetical protein